MDNNFVPWLVQELEKRDWSQRELGRRAGVSIGTVSQVLSEQRPPSAEFCIAIAQALRIQPEYALRLAGYLPPVADPDTIPPDVRAAVDELLVYWRELRDHDPEKLRQLMDIAITQASFGLAAAKYEQQQKDAAATGETTSRS